MSDLAILVDKNDKTLGHKSRFELEEGDIIRISLLWVQSPDGKVLLAKRSANKKHDPNKWGPAAGGTLEPDETYETNIYKEAEEEIGLTGHSFKKLNKVLYMTYDGTGRFCQFFKLVAPLDIEKLKIQESEVAEIRWFSKEEIRELINNKKDTVTGSHKIWLDLMRAS